MKYEEMVKIAYEEIIDSFEKEAQAVVTHYDVPDRYKAKSDYERLKQQRKINTPSLGERLFGGVSGNTARDISSSMRAGNNLFQALGNVSAANDAKRKSNAVADNEMRTIKRISRVTGAPVDQIKVNRFGSTDEFNKYMSNRVAEKTAFEKEALVNPNQHKIPSFAKVDGPTRFETPDEKAKREFQKRHPLLSTLQKIPESGRTY